MASATLTTRRPAPAPFGRLRAIPAATWAKVGFALLCAGALAGYFVYPTYPTYDSFYALLWGRDLLHLHVPDFRVYRGPTEHPLAIAFGMLCSIFGQGGARLAVLGSIASFVAVVAGMYRLGRLCFGPVVGLFAALLVLSRFFIENLAAQGYLDISYIALVVWALALEVERPRRGTVVFLLLAAAGLLRPDAWVLSGAYWLWCAWPLLRRHAAHTALHPAAALAGAVGSAASPNASPGSWAGSWDEPPGGTAPGSGERASGGEGSSGGEGLSGREGSSGGEGLSGREGSSGGEGSSGEGSSRGGPSSRGRLLRYLCLALIAPVVWVCVDALVTGDPLYSLHATAELAQELERSQGLTNVLASVWTFGTRIDKLPVLLGAIVGLGLALWLAPRRTLFPLAALLVMIAAFVAEGAAGASLVDRYFMSSATVVLLFCAVALGGWSMLSPGTAWRRVWMAAAAALIVYGGLSAAASLSLSNLRTTLAYHEDFHKGLATALASPPVKAALARCPLLSLPDNKLIPDARWILDSTGQQNIVARTQARSQAQAGDPRLEQRLQRGSVAVYPLGSAVFFEAIVDVGDDPRVQVPQPGFRRIYTSRYYAVYANC